MKTRSFKIVGRVQGVGFRYRTREKAQKLGLTGYVQNNYDGSVTCLIQGDEPVLNIMEEWLTHGPSFALVEQLLPLEIDENDVFEQFTIRR